MMLFTVLAVEGENMSKAMATAEASSQPSSRLLPASTDSISNRDAAEARPFVEDPLIAGQYGINHRQCRFRVTLARGGEVVATVPGRVFRDPECDRSDNEYGNTTATTLHVSCAGREPRGNGGVVPPTRGTAKVNFTAGHI